MSSRFLLERVLAWSFFSLAGCASNDGPDPFHVAFPQKWENANENVVSPSNAMWWHAISDSNLKRMIEICLGNNLTIERGQLALRRVLAQNQLNLQSIAPLSQSSLSLNSTGGRRVEGTSNGSASLSMSYTLDIWGNKRRSRELDRISSLLANADLSQLKWLVTTELAIQYWAGGAASAKSKLMRENLASFDADLTTIARRVEVGKATRSDAHAVELMRENYASQIKYLETQVENSRQQVKTLLGGIDPPGKFDLPTSFSVRSPVMSISAPASVLDRRPDVASARLELDAALIQRQIANRSGYPDLQISANLSSSAEVVRQILSNPVAFLGTTLSVPYINAETSKFVSARADIDLKIATANFKERVVAALADIEVYFVEAKQIDAAYSAARVRRDYAAAEVQKVMVRYRVGRASLVDVRRAEREERDAVSAEIDISLQDWLNFVGTLRALGGPI